MLMRVLDAAFGHPRGLVGRLGGALMARGNATQERWAGQQADLRPGGQVLVVGPGPGVGIALASAAVAPGGHVVGVDPSQTMRQMAATAARPTSPPDASSSARSSGRRHADVGTHSDRGRCTMGAGSRRDLVTVAIGMWLVAAVSSDGWAHFNVPEPAALGLLAWRPDAHLGRTVQP